MRFNSIEELVRAAPADLGVSEWAQVSQDDVEAFAGATRAREWIHTDAERAAREGPFGGPVVHAFLTLSLATHFQTQLLDLPGSFYGVNYGIRSARFPAPVPVGSRVRARGRLAEAMPEGDRARIVVELVYELEGASRPPCVAELISLVIHVNEAARGAD